MRKPSWKIRRRIVHITLVYCGAIIGYITVFGGDSALQTVIVGGAFSLAGAVIGSYIFGAAYCDNNHKQ